MTKVAKNSHFLLAWRRIFPQLILLAHVNCHVIGLVRLSYIFSSLFTKVQSAKEQLVFLMLDLLKHMGKNTAWHQVSNKQVTPFILVYERNHYFGLGPILKPKQKIG